MTNPITTFCASAEVTTTTPAAWSLSDLQALVGALIASVSDFGSCAAFGCGAELLAKYPPMCPRHWVLSQRQFADEAETPRCGTCHTCAPQPVFGGVMVLCATCGNKRCPHANDCRNKCSGSNAPGQAGGAYEDCPDPTIIRAAAAPGPVAAPLVEPGEQEEPFTFEELRGFYGRRVGDNRYEATLKGGQVGDLLRVYDELRSKVAELESEIGRWKFAHTATMNRFAMSETERTYEAKHHDEHHTKEEELQRAALELAQQVNDTRATLTATEGQRDHLEQEKAILSKALVATRFEVDASKELVSARDSEIARLKEELATKSNVVSAAIAWRDANVYPVNREIERSMARQLEHFVMQFDLASRGCATAPTTEASDVAQRPIVASEKGGAQ